MKSGKHLTVPDGLAIVAKAHPRLAADIGALKRTIAASRASHRGYRIVGEALTIFAIQRGMKLGTFADAIKWVVRWVIDHPEEVAALIKLLVTLITSLTG